MFTKRINTALPAQFEGTPGIYAKRESPPQIPLTTERPIQQSTNKDSLSSLIGNSHVSLVCNRVDSSTQSIANALDKMPDGKSNDGVRRLSHTPQQTQRRAVARYELSSHSFNAPHSSSYLNNNNSAAQRRGKPASLENARNSQDNNQDAHFTKGRLGPSLSFGNFVEPLILEPIALQNVYFASARNATAIQERWQQRNNNINNVDLNFTVARDPTKLDLDRLPPGWEIGLTNEQVRYYIDHNNGRTHWIHPLAPENLTPGWTKIFDKIHGVVYYNHLEHRSQFEHPGLASSAISGSILPTIHGSSSLQSIEDIQMGNDIGIGQKDEKNSQNVEEDGDDDLNIINNEDVPEWLKLYSQAPFSADHLLNFNLFKTTHLAHFDNLIMKLYKAEIMSIARKYDGAMCRIDSELNRRHAEL